MARNRTYYPIFLDLQGRKCVVVGGGAVGERKTKGALCAGAQVMLVSPEVTGELARLHRLGRICLIRRAYRQGDLEGAVLAFAATERPEINRRVAAEARAKGIPLNCADRADAGDFLIPSTFRRGALCVAVSTGGRSPAYARMVRERLEALFGPEHGEFLELLERLRPEILHRFRDNEKRRREVWQRLVSWEAVELAKQGRWDAVEGIVSECLSQR